MKSSFVSENCTPLAFFKCLLQIYSIRTQDPNSSGVSLSWSDHHVYWSCSSYNATGNWMIRALVINAFKSRLGKSVSLCFRQEHLAPPPVVLEGHNRVKQEGKREGRRHGWYKIQEKQVTAFNLPYSSYSCSLPSSYVIHYKLYY